MKKKSILISFIGSNDLGRLEENRDGAILTALTNENFDEAIFLYNKSNSSFIDYEKIADYLLLETKKRKLVKKAECFELPIKDVTDHNHIYKLLKEFTDKLEKNENIKYTAAISSGTPAMQVCWILLAESGDFSNSYQLSLIKIKDPKFGKSSNIEVKIDTSLPKILRLKEENESLKKDLMPRIFVDVKKGKVEIGNKLINLAPIEFCYYRYFAEKVKEKKESEYFGGLFVPLEFLEKIFYYHEESFPGLDINREEIRKMIKNKTELSITTFRGNISKVNKKLSESIKNKAVLNNCIIKVEGRRGAKFYGINALYYNIIINK